MPVNNRGGGIFTVAAGGTGSGSFTDGSVIFSNGTILTQDNANLFFDDITNEFGIGTAAPAATLHVSHDAGTIPTLDAATVLVINDNAGTSDSCRLSIISGGTGVAQLNFGNATDEDRGNVSYNMNADVMTFITSTGERMRIDTNGNVGIGSTAFGTSAAGVLSVKNGTAPSTGPADTVQFYSSDNSAGNTIPSFFAEGTEILQTGQADIASATRVRVRINGTVVQLLGV